MVLVEKKKLVIMEVVVLLIRVRSVRGTELWNTVNSNVFVVQQQRQ